MRSNTRGQNPWLAIITKRTLGLVETPSLVYCDLATLRVRSVLQRSSSILTELAALARKGVFAEPVEDRPRAAATLSSEGSPSPPPLEEVADAISPSCSQPSSPREAKGTAYGSRAA